MQLQRHDSPCSERVDATCGLMPARQSLRAETENQIELMRYVGMIMEKGSLLVTLYLQIYDYVLPPLVRMW